MRSSPCQMPIIHYCIHLMTVTEARAGESTVREGDGMGSRTGWEPACSLEKSGN